MRNHFFAITAMLAAGAGLVACSDDDDSSSPFQPSPLANAPAGPQGFAGGPPISPAGLTAGADAAGGGIAQLAPVPDGFNAYNAQIEYVDGEVTITFVPVDMPRMPPAAGAHRNRAVTVRHCPVEPHHVGQVCGDGAPVFQDSFAFGGSPSRTFTMPECSGWLVIEVAELSDDRYDGWRNAPLACRTDEAGRAVATVDTDGNGDGWDGSRYDPPARAESEAEQAEQEAEEEEQEAERVQRAVNEAIADAVDRFVPSADPVDVNVNELFTGTAGTTGDDYRATSSDTAVATVELTPNPRVKITPVGPGTTTIRVDNLRSAERVEFTVTVERPGNRPPAITDPGNKAYVQGQTIEAFPIAVTDADEDPVTVTVTGLPDGLTWSSETGMVSGTVAADAEAQAYTVTVTANDGTNADVTDTFTITIGSGNMPPTIGSLENRSYEQGQTIEAFPIPVTDQDDTPEVTVTGLPDGLTWSSGRVSGTVAANAPARAHTVTVTANDGTNADVTDTFTITVTVNRPPTITIPGTDADRSYMRGDVISAFTIMVTDLDAGDEVTVTVDGLPDGLTASEMGRVSGTVAADAPARVYEVTVTASDGVARATETFTITVTLPAWRSLRAADLHVLDQRTSGFPAPPAGSRIELSSFSAWAVRGMPGHVLFEWSVSRGSLAPAPRTWRDCRIGIRFDDSDDYNRYHLKAGWFENGIAQPLPAPYGPTDSMENPPFLDVWNTSSTVLRAFADLRPDTPRERRVRQESRRHGPARRDHGELRRVLQQLRSQ